MGKIKGFMEFERINEGQSKKLDREKRRSEPLNFSFL